MQSGMKYLCLRNGAFLDKRPFLEYDYPTATERETDKRIFPSERTSIKMVLYDKHCINKYGAVRQG